MGNCSKHKKEVAGISDMKQLAEIIGDLHYETLSKLIWELQTKLHDDAVKDLKGGRYKLFHALQRASKFMFEASNEIENAWEISKPFMEENKPTTP